MSRKLITVILALVLSPVLICGGLYIGEWIATERAYQQWLAENPLRVDFSTFQTQEEVRNGLLEMLPVGTSEEVLREFYLENEVQGQMNFLSQDRLPTTPWKPSGNSCEEFCNWYLYQGAGPGPEFCQSDRQFSCSDMRLDVYIFAGRGHGVRRAVSGTWVIFFLVDSETHALLDIQVRYYGSWTL